MIVVIGAGILGLSVAYDLGRRGYPVTVVEKGKTAGGLAAPLTLDNGARVEKFYHHFFAGQRHLLELLTELGLDRSLCWFETRMGFYCDGQLHPFDRPQDILRFDPLPPLDRVRFAMGALLLARSPWGGGQEPAIDWLGRVCGEAATRTIWAPLLKMKFGSAYDSVSIGWLKGRVRDRQRGRSGAGSEKLGYLHGSIGAITDSLETKIRDQGNQLFLDCTVDRLEIDGGRVTAVWTGEHNIPAEAVVATVPNPVFCRLAPQLDPPIRKVLESIRYQGSVCVMVLARRPLTDYYWINVVDPGLPFVVAVEHTNFMDPQIYGGHLIYLGKYLERDAPEWSLSEAALIEEFLKGLRSMCPDLARDDIVNVWLSKDPLTQPVFSKDYRQPSMNTGVENLFLANTSMLFPNSRTVDSSIRLARKVSRKVLAVVE